MRIHTIEENFQYRMHHILIEFKKEYDQLVKDNSGKSLATFDEWLWNNSEDFGQRVIEDIETYCGLDEALENEN